MWCRLEVARLRDHAELRRSAARGCSFAGPAHGRWILEGIGRVFGVPTIGGGELTPFGLSDVEAQVQLFLKRFPTRPPKAILVPLNVESALNSLLIVLDTEYVASTSVTCNIQV